MTGLSLSQSRALRRPRKLDLRAVFGLLLLFVATGGSLAFWSSASETRSILIATHELPAGATLSDADLAVAHVQVDDAIYQAAVPANDLPQFVGRQLAEPIHAQQVLVRSQLSSRSLLGPNQLAMTIPVSPETAAGGRLREGDTVEVLLTTDKGKPEAHTIVVLPRVTVYDVGYEERVGAINAGSSAGRAVQDLISWMTVVVSPEQAVALAQAKWAGELDVALLPPE